MRHDLYARLQQLPMAFHGQWQSGQLLSRVTNDLSSIRRFFGFGLLFLVMNILQLVVVTLVLLHMYWPLGLVVAAASRADHRAVQPLRAPLRPDLPPGAGPAGRPRDAAEEGAVGIRVIKSFGRGPFVSAPLRRRRPHALRHLDGQGPAVREVLDLPRGDPQLRGRSWCCCSARSGVGRGDLTPGTLVAFITLMLSLVWPIAVARLHPRDGAGGDDRRRPDPGDLRHRALHRLRRPRASRSRAATCASRASASPSPTSPTSPCSTTSTSRSRPVRRSRSSGPPAPARPR